MLFDRTETVDGVRHASGFFEMRPGYSLYHQQWTTARNSTPLIIVHGGGDHSGRHGGTARRLVRAGYAVHAFDLPGHGRSPGARGHIRCFDEYLASIRMFVRVVSRQYAGQPPALLGHSLGGLIGTYYASRHPDTIRCLVLSSPLWGLNFRAPLWKRWLAYCLLPVWPALTMKRPHIRDNVLSHDPEVTAIYMSDPLIHDQVSVRFYAELQRQLRGLPMVLPQLQVPTLVLQAGADRVSSPQMTGQLFPRIGSTRKMLIMYDGYYHEVLHEVDKERVFEDMIAWLRVLTTTAPILSDPPLLHDGLENKPS